MPEQEIIVIGASARAACFSARRSACSPYWIDDYGDVDVTENFPGQRIPAGSYPEGILDLIDASPAAPFLYTGAMENHLQVLQELEGRRELLGNSADVCRVVRDPERLVACFSRAGITFPRLGPGPQASGLKNIHYLLKPVRSAGGLGVRHYQADENIQRGEEYLQEFIEGESRAGVYLADGRNALLLGVTRQLVGEDFLHAGQFSYCGSIGPLAIDEDEHEQWRLIGNSLAAEAGLRGLFGVDAVVSDGAIYPVEVNPRYTASVEVIELALQLPVIRLHSQACHGRLPSYIGSNNGMMKAKAYLFAWSRLRGPVDKSEIYDSTEAFPSTADIPQAGSLVSSGHPLMTIFGGGRNQGDALNSLRKKAKLLYSRFEVV